ncbi:DUF4251 domain-containing protein [Winogradskyella haliclonae]|uniref:DUF4251 domain-containing protein n=1 Tax=Winogradskyella haliclonae TaxID=2048558 RepID=A0ABQ2BYA6_9FLAO|nr:DUF4251 domain-containing protein [Winogradskyella haliclonae]GGI57465.1 hypothetical protein GCM10011444_17740 [Winogradskyella haliclonae]
MKKLFFILILIIFTFNISFSQTQAEVKQDKKEIIEAQFNEIKALIESGNFQFEALWANPLGNDIATIGQSLLGSQGVFQGNRVNLVGNDNFVKIENKNSDIYLPYFGRVFFPKRITNESGIHYKGEIENYKVGYNEKKKVITVKFTANSQGDFLRFNYRITALGATRLTVTSTNRQTISYDGKITQGSIEITKN